MDNMIIDGDNINAGKYLLQDKKLKTLNQDVKFWIMQRSKQQAWRIIVMIHKPEYKLINLNDMETANTVGWTRFRNS